MGFLSQTTPNTATAATLAHAVLEFAEILYGIAARGPLAIRLAKLVIRHGADADQATGQIIERLAQSLLYQSEDKAEGTGAFLEKRTPRFLGQ